MSCSYLRAAVCVCVYVCVHAYTHICICKENPPRITFIYIYSCFVFKLSFHFYSCMYMGVLPACMSVHHMHARYPQRPDRALDL